MVIDEDVLADVELAVRILTITHLFDQRQLLIQCAEHEGPIGSELIQPLLDVGCLLRSQMLLINVRDVEKELWVVSQVQVECAKLSVRNGSIVDGDLHKVQQSKPVRRRHL